MSINIQQKNHHRVIKSLTLLIALSILNFEMLWPIIPILADSENSHFSTRCDDSENSNRPGECIWGHIYYQGRPIEGAKVNFTFRGNKMTTATQIYPGDSTPYYKIRLGVETGDILKITANFAKQTVTQSFKIGDHLTTENGFMLGLATRGNWKLWYLNMDQANQLHPTDETLLVGSSEGLSMISEHISQRMTTYRNGSQLNDQWMENGNETIVRDIAVDIRNRIWVVGQEDIFVWIDAHGWELMEDTSQRDVKWQTLGIDHEADVVWAGGKRNITESFIENSITDPAGYPISDARPTGYIAAYDSHSREWTSEPSLAAPVTALAIDDHQDLWVGTWGAGIYQRHSNGQWTHFQTEDGLPSNYIYTIYTQPGFLAKNHYHETIPSAVWVGTGANGESSRGGIGYYSLSEKQWRTYTIEHGLPISLSASLSDGDIQNKAGDRREDITTDIFTLLMTDDGLLWAGTEAGLYIFGDNTIGQERWSLHDENLQEEIRALTLFQDTIIAATPDRLLRLVPTLLTDEQPSISIVPSRRNSMMSAINQLPNYINETGIVAWRWESSLDGLLCTTEYICQFSNLSLGTHELTLRLQTQYDTWLTPITTNLTLEHTIYLPCIK